MPRSIFNVLGESLQYCSMLPMPGFYRNAFCETGEGVHLVCVVISEDFPEFRVL